MSLSSSHDALYRSGRIKFLPGALQALTLSPTLADLLVKQGVPLFSKDNAVLGVVFQVSDVARVIELGKRRFLDIGCQAWDPAVLRIGLELGSEAVFAVSVDAKAEASFINTNLPSFLSFLAGFQGFLDRARQPDVASIMTQEQARERLAALRRGEVRPAAAQATQFDRAAELSKIKLEFKREDPAAFSDKESWWSRILEQAEDGLI